MTESLWTSEAIVAATGGRAGAAFAANGVSIDSREITGAASSSSPLPASATATTSSPAPWPPARPAP